MKRKTTAVEVPAGLIIRGVVTERTKRMVPFDNPTTEIVTYVISDKHDHKYYVDDFSPEQYFEIDENIESPVYVRPYRKRNGDLSYNLCFLKASRSTRGEPF